MIGSWFVRISFPIIMVWNDQKSHINGYRSWLPPAVLVAQQAVYRSGWSDLEAISFGFLFAQKTLLFELTIPQSWKWASSLHQNSITKSGSVASLRINHLHISTQRSLLLALRSWPNWKWYAFKVRSFLRITWRHEFLSPKAWERRLILQVLDSE